jgi:hypothetical protein
MKRLVIAFSALWLLAPALPAPLRAFGEDPRFMLGVLRRDGVVIPFAAFDKHRWIEPWPADVKNMELPITLDDVPKRWWGVERPSQLTAWAEGKTLGAVTPGKPATIPVMCMPRMALQTGYKSKEPAPPPGVQPFPKDGLVISDGSPIQPLMSVPRTSPDWAASAVAILDAFNAAEEVELRNFTSWRHPASRDARRRQPVELEALYRAAMDDQGWTAYYVEAVRRYTPGPRDEGCGLVTFTSGWVRIGPKGKPLYDLGSRVTYCDRKGAGYMLPLGLMNVEGKTYWIYQISGYDREWFVVSRPTPREIQIHVDYPAGACPTAPGGVGAIGQ